MEHTTESPGKEARMEMGSPRERGALAGCRVLVFCGMVLLCGVTALLAVSCNLFTAEFKDVKAEELKRMVDSGALLLIVDTRIDREYREGRLPRSVNIPPHKFARIEQYLPREKDTRIVFYCRGFG
jgi:hypothetical protein